MVQSSDPVVMDLCLERSGQRLHKAGVTLSQIFGSKQVSMGKNSDPLERNPTSCSPKSTKHPTVSWALPMHSPSSQPLCQKGLESHAGLCWAVKAGYWGSVEGNTWRDGGWS